LAKVPMFLVLFLLVRGVPAFLYRHDFPRQSVKAMAILQSAGLPLIVVITGLGVESGQMRSDNAAALVGAGLMSVVIFPIVGLALQGRAPADDLATSEVSPHHT
jgi:Kef-type K+ transport system membrane component KefB